MTAGEAGTIVRVVGRGASVPTMSCWRTNGSEVIPQVSVRRSRGVGKIGVAIPVPEPAGGELAAWRAQLGDPEAELIVPHVTLLPPTTIPALALPTVADHLAAVVADSAPFRIELRGADSFRPASPTVFVPLTVGADDCRRLEKAVRAGPLARELRHPYHPHVTVAHDLAEPALDGAQVALAGFAADFAVRALTLFEQRRGGEWRPLRELAFGGNVGRTSEEPAAGAAGSSEER